MVEILLRTPTGRSLGDRLAGSDLAAPELLDVEVAAALRRGVQRGEAHLDDVVAALDVLQAWPIERIGHRDLIATSMRWWDNVSAYDAVYLAVAVMHDAPVVTVDGPLSRAPVPEVRVENVRVT